jgi:hypothetical protein
MGTRCEIHLRGLGAHVELWKHWDGYPEHMMPFFKEFVAWAKEKVENQTQWLLCPEDVAAYLIAFDYEKAKEVREVYGLPIPLKPDIRPRGMINDLEYVYIIDLGEVWTIKCYESKRFGLTERERRLIRERREDEVKSLVKVCEEKIPVVVSLTAVMMG